jgi:hypothetical protein
MDLCGDGVGREGGLADEDQVTTYSNLHSCVQV